MLSPIWPRRTLLPVPALFALEMPFVVLLLLDILPLTPFRKLDWSGKEFTVCKLLFFWSYRKEQNFLLSTRTHWNHSNGLQMNCRRRQCFDLFSLFRGTCANTVWAVRRSYQSQVHTLRTVCPRHWSFFAFRSGIVRSPRMWWMIWIRKHIPVYTHELLWQSENIILI